MAATQRDCAVSQFGPQPPRPAGVCGRHHHSPSIRFRIGYCGRDFHEIAVCGNHDRSRFTGSLRVRRPRRNRSDRAAGREHSQGFSRRRARRGAGRDAAAVISASAGGDEFVRRVQTGAPHRHRRDQDDRGRRQVRDSQGRDRARLKRGQRGTFHYVGTLEKAATKSSIRAANEQHTVEASASAATR